MIRMWWKKCKRRKPNWEWWWVRWEKKNRERKGLNQCHTWTDETSETLFWLRLRQERGGHWGLGGTREQGRQQKTLAQNQMSLFVIPPAMFGRFFFSKGNRLKENKIRTPVKPWKREINYIYCYFSTQHLLLLFQKRNSQ